MRNISHSVLLLILVLTFSICHAESSSPVHSSGKFEFSATEFGQSHPFAKIHARVLGRNVSGKLIQIDRIVARDPVDTTIRFKPVQIKPGESYSVDLDIVLSESVGRVAHYFDVYAKGESEPIDGFVVRGFSDWLVSPVGTSLDFGAFEVAMPVLKSVPIEVKPGASVHLVGVERPSAYFDVKFTNGGNALELRSKADAPWSSFDEKLLVRTDNPLQPIVVFQLKGQARGSVVPSSDPLDFGLLREGQAAELILVLNDVTGKPLDIGKVVVRSRVKVSTSVADCVPKSESCKNLKVAYPPMSLRGMVGGMLEIDLPSYKRTLFVRLGAIGIGKDTQIRSLEDDFKATQDGSKSISAVFQSNVAKAPEKILVPTTMSTPDGTGPLLKWQVANEYDIYGYEIYRSETEAGPYAMASSKILERLEGDPEAGSMYQWRDSTAKSGTTYWYYINIVYNNGRKQKFTNPQKIVAK